MFNKINIASIEYKTAIEQLQSTLRSEFNEELKSDCTELKSKYPNLDYIFILGSTPEWNDGEECTHSSSVYIENTSNYTECEEYFDRLSGEFPDNFKDYNKNLKKHEVNEIKSIISKSRLKYILEIIYETNFNIVIDFTENDVNVTVEEYECGY